MASRNNNSENLHANHRKRLRSRYIQHGLDSFEDHVVLELLLTYAIPRIDVNPLAHRLLNHFGSLAAVFNASVDELTNVTGIGESAAILIHLISDVYRRASISAIEPNPVITGVESAGRILAPHFIGEREEVVYAISINARGEVLRVSQQFRGSFNSAIISIQKIAEMALKTGAVGVIVAHNHPSGVALPSDEDLDTTYALIKALLPLGIQLVDHIIFADNDYVSLAASGHLKNLK